MTYDDILAEARTYLDEENEDLYLDEELDLFIHQAYKDIAARLECIQTTTTLAVSSATTTMNLTQQGNSLRRITLSTGAPIARISMTELDAISNANYTATAAQPTYYYLWGDTLGVYPVPAASVTLTLYLIDVNPADIAGTTEPSLPAMAHGLMSLYAASKALHKDLELQAADTLWAKYEKGLESVAAQLDSTAAATADSWVN